MDSRTKKIVKQLKKYDPEKIIIFGSQAKGASDPFSDIDLIIIKKTPKRFLNRLKDVIRIIKPEYALDVLVYTPQELKKMVSEGSYFIKHVLEEGETIYERT